MTDKFLEVLDIFLTQETETNVTIEFPDLENHKNKTKIFLSNVFTNIQN